MQQALRPPLDKRRRALVCALLTTVLLAAPAQAAIYKWVDEEGSTHFSQTPPPKRDTKVSRVRVHGSSASDVEFPPEVQSAYCGKLQEAAHTLGRAMRNGASADRALTASHANELQLAVKQIVGFVFGFKRSDAAPSEIASLVHTQCMNGTYNAHLESYVRKHRPELLAARTASKPAGRSGTAWPVSRGLAVTNNHVVSGAKNLVLVRSDGQRISARVVARDADNDLALLAVDRPSDLPLPLPLAASPAGLGAEVFTIGYPHVSLMGRSPKVTQGIVSADTGLRDDERYYQISVPIQAGNSGGPLLSMHGQVIGVVTAKLNALAVFRRSGDLPQNVNYAIKSDLVADLMATLPGSPGPVPAVQQDGATLERLSDAVKDSVMIVLAD